MSPIHDEKDDDHDIMMITMMMKMLILIDAGGDFAVEYVNGSASDGLHHTI